MLKRQKRDPLPPKTWRYCPVCKELRKFKFNHCIWHSECVVCGARNIKELEEHRDSSFIIEYVPPKRTIVIKIRNKDIPKMNCPKCLAVLPSNAKRHKTCGWWITGTPRDPPSNAPQ